MKKRNGQYFWSPRKKIISGSSGIGGTGDPKPLSKFPSVDWEKIDLPVENAPATHNWRFLHEDGKIVGLNRGSNKGIYSTDLGETWQYTTLPITANWSDIVYHDGNNRFFAVGITSNGYLTAVYTSDGVIWNYVNIGQTVGVEDVVLVYGNGHLIVTFKDVNTNYYWFSFNGTSWTYSHSSTFFPAIRAWSFGAYAKGKFLFFTAGEHYVHSSDGMMWTETTHGGTEAHSLISNDEFCIIPGNAEFRRTNNLTDWVRTQIHSNLAGRCESGCWINGMFVVLPIKGAQIAFSKDAITWYVTNNPFGDFNGEGFYSTDARMITIGDKLLATMPEWGGQIRIGTLQI